MLFHPRFSHRARGRNPYPRGMAALLLTSRLLQGEGLGRQHGGKQDDYQKYGQQAYFFHINLRNNVLS